MWISALLGMCTKFSEVTLAVHFREKNAEGDLVGGPMYYIKNGLKKQWHWLAYLFAAFGVLTVFGTGNEMCIRDRCNDGLSIRHTTRNFPNREGSKPGNGQMSAVALMDARSIAATAANGGILTSAEDLDCWGDVPEYEFDPSVYNLSLIHI